MGQARRQRESDPGYGKALVPHFEAVETGLEAGGAPKLGHIGHGEFHLGDHLVTVLDGCILCGRKAGVEICAEHGISVEDQAGWTELRALIELDAVSGLSLGYDGIANRLCEDYRIKHAPLSAALHKRLDRLGDELRLELQRRYDGPLCEIKWLRREPTGVLH